MKKSRAKQDNGAEVTVPQQSGRYAGLKPWQPGQSGNPDGRPKGARSNLTEAFIAALHADFVEHGIAAIQAARIEGPAEYLRIIAGILPKKIELDEEQVIYVISDRPLSPEEWEAKYANAAGLADGNRSGSRVNASDATARSRVATPAGSAKRPH